LKSRLYILALFAAMQASVAFGEVKSNEPHIGYLYPAGGQRGTTFRIVAGGQFLRGAKDVLVTGEGVHGKVLKTYVMPPNLNKEQVDAIRERIIEARARLTGQPVKPAEEKPADPNAKQVREVDHPLLYDLEHQSLRELANDASIIFAPRGKRQQNRQLSEMVLIEVAADANAPAGVRELRLVAGQGMTNPVAFGIGQLAEVRELEPNGDSEAKVPWMGNVPKADSVTVPVTLNGQIFPGDTDKFRMRARRGQQLVIVTHARSLLPYLADAVPGWFQATVTLRDVQGKEVAFADDYRFNPDPVMYYRIEKDGEYELEIRDAIYRGREDFVYRVSIDEGPFVTQVFPLGAREGTAATLAVDGWNLVGNKLNVDTSPGAEIRQTTYSDAKGRSEPILYAVGRLPECDEKELGDAAKPQDVNLPIIINGHIGKPGDVDVFRFSGKAGQDVVAEVMARQLNSPVDSLVRITDEAGKVLGSNDDYVIKGEAYLYKDAGGVLTHHADSYLSVKLPKDGKYLAQISDTQRQGGAAYGYRLRLSEPMPDFALRMTPSSLNFPATGTAAFYVHVLRKDGFAGEITVSLKDAPAGYRIDGGVIPAGCDGIAMTISAPRKLSTEPLMLHLEGTAKVGKETIVRPVVPAEDMMQAFLYRHLVPSQTLLAAAIRPARGMPFIEVASGTTRIPSGGTTKVTMRVPPKVMMANIKLELENPPKEISLGDVSFGQGTVTLQVAADKNIATGLKGNLIVSATREAQAAQGGKAAVNKQILGPLPAIPFEVVGK
jgi:hypothetical protein